MVYIEIKIVKVIFLVRFEEIIIVGLGLILIVKIFKYLFWLIRGIKIFVNWLLGVKCCCIDGEVEKFFVFILVIKFFGNWMWWWRVRDVLILDFEKGRFKKIFFFLLV